MLKDGTPYRSRPRGDCGRHHAQRRARAHRRRSPSIAASWSMTQLADQHARHLRHRRMRRASRRLLRPGRARLRAGKRAGRHVSPATTRATRQRPRHQSQGLRRQCFLGRRLPGRAGTEADRALATRASATYKKLVIANGRLIGAVLFGDTADGALVSRSDPRPASPIETFRDDSMFGRALAERKAA